jgi:hypothetical protein
MEVFNMRFAFASDAKLFAKNRKKQGYNVRTKYISSAAHPSYTVYFWEDIITQNVEWLHNRLLNEKIYNTEQAQEFLALSKAEYYGETEKYFFKYADVFAFKEIRLHKKTLRVTLSLHKTKVKKLKE